MTNQKYYIEQKFVKIFLFLLLTITFLSSNFCSAQSYRLKELTINGLNRCHSDNFEKNQDLDSLIIKYDKNEPVELFFKYENKEAKQNRKSYFYLKFPGDLFLLKRDYPNLKIPDYPIYDLKIIDEKYDEKNELINYTITAILTKDSLKYMLTEWLHKGTKVQRELSSIPYEGFNASYKKGNAVLEENLNKDIPGIRNINKETHYLFKGIVDQKGYINNMQMLMGNDKVGNQILRSLQQSGPVWQPRILGGRVVKSYIEIFAQVQNGVLKVFTCGYNR